MADSRAGSLTRLPLMLGALIAEGVSLAAPCTCWLPTCTCLMVRGMPPKAVVMASAITRYLPSLSEEMAYMTTKKASKSVNRSA